ncbi:MAG: methionine--tRNA ligase [Candidatus Harrisonbacteria bacterium]|nr:methionine--tRNA ligase [Candidatus Harrisonbacteria bacterium]
MKKFYITTSIAYVNAPPHIGFALESIQADVLARWRRQRDFDVFFLTGADEHGAKIVRAAEAAGSSPKKFTDEISEKFRNLKKVLNLSWDDFIRTSDQKRHWPNAQKIWKAIEKSGDLYKKIYRGRYCVGHEAFITEKDLEDGVCRDHKTKPETIEEENWFFKLSKYSEKIKKAIKKGGIEILPESRKNEILSLISDGLEDVSFSRPNKDLSWGVPVPGDPDSTMYVWADALSNYLLPEKYWPADIHVIGKDILRFHAAIWPGMLLSAGLKLPKKIFVHGFITVDGQKMSKTIGNVVTPEELVKKYGSDAVRYYLLREISSGEDGDYSEEKFKERYNGDLANGLGNFAARVLALGEKLGEVDIDLKKVVERAISKTIDQTRKTVEKKVNEFKLHEALSAIWELIGCGDAYVNEKKLWEGEKKNEILNAVVILDNLAVLLVPFLPETSGKITKAIHWSDKKTLRVSKIGVLFPRL